VLANRPAIAADLRSVRARLLQAAQQNMRRIRAQIEGHGPRHRRTGPKVTIAVIGSGSAEKDQRTLTSCTSQTYENADVLVIGAESEASIGACLQDAIASCSSEYLTWVDGGDWFADDALDCLVSCLEEEKGWDVVYADYYAMSESNLPLGYHSVPGPERLFRRDVVGPCNLLRRSLLTRLDPPPPDAPLFAYNLWLQANRTGVLGPFHAPLFYSARPVRSRQFIAQEREVRRRWRKSRPVWSRALWGAIDTDLGERLVVQPLIRLRNLLRRIHADNF
jgi:hypothetical protein